MEQARQPPMQSFASLPARASSAFANQSTLAFDGNRIGNVAMLLVALVTGAMLYTGRSGMLTYAYPAMAVGVGALLLATAPTRIVTWVLWLWMISPFIRRVVDAQNGWNPQNPILLAPLLVSALCALDVLYHAPRLSQSRALPGLLAIVSVIGGVAVGLTVSEPMLVMYAALTWLAPVLLGLHVLVHPERHAEYHRTLSRSLMLGVLAVGLYGVLQFVSPPLWDRLWMIESRMDSIGVPEPMRVRVFSSMNAPGPLAQFLSAALLIVLAARSAWRWPALVAGMTVFLLSLARSAWLGFAVGFVVLLVMAPRHTRRSGIAMIAAAVFAVSAINFAPLPPTMDAMRTTIERRMSSLEDLSMDDSYRARQYLIKAVLADISERPLGSGLGATLVGGASGSASSRLADQGLYLDNGFLEIYLVFGWFGGSVFLVSVSLALWLAWQRVRTIGFGFGYVAAAIALLSQLVGGTIFAGVGGGMFWLATAMACTAVTVVQRDKQGQRLQGA